MNLYYLFTNFYALFVLLDSIFADLITHLIFVDILLYFPYKQFKFLLLNFNIFKRVMIISGLKYYCNLLFCFVEFGLEQIKLKIVNSKIYYFKIALTLKIFKNF